MFSDYFNRGDHPSLDEFKRAFTHNEIQTDFLLKKYRSVIQPIMGDEPVLAIVQPMTINTMLNNNWLNNRPIFLSKKSAEFRYV